MSASKVEKRRAQYKSSPIASPTWKDNYRRRCIDNLKKRRECLLSKYRNIPPDVTTDVNDVMMSELSPLAGDIYSNDGDDLATFLEELKQELIDAEQRLISEYTMSEEAFIASALSHRDDVVCPICCQGNITVSASLGTCSYCHVSLYVDPNRHLGESISSALSQHNSSCSHDVHFSLMRMDKDQPSLIISCNHCDVFTIIE